MQRNKKLNILSLRHNEQTWLLVLQTVRLMLSVKQESCKY